MHDFFASLVSRRRRRLVAGLAHASRACARQDQARPRYGARSSSTCRTASLPGGSLAVKKGDEIVPLINKIAKAFQNVVLTQDWHTPGPRLVRLLPRRQEAVRERQAALRQPDPVARSLRAGHRRRRHPQGLDIPHAQLVIRKGFNRNVDSYSAFIEADGKLKTGLDGYLKERGIKTVFVAGLATDFCVAWTAMDARKLGLDAYVIEDACRGIDTQGSLAAAWKDMEKAGVKRIQSSQIALPG